MFRHTPLIERVVVFLLLVIIGVFSWQVYCYFLDENSASAPAEGGVYTEGVVGRLTTLNPLLARSSADRDVSQLIFSGLTRFNPVSGQIEGDLATHTLSSDRLTYTFTLKDNIFWHDGEPVTADDVIYTYKVVLQNPYFKNTFLRGAFKDVDIQRLSDHEVIFVLKQPYTFFLTNVTVGILPKHILNLVPIENLEQSDFNQNPVGSGPFEFVSLENKPSESRVVLKRFEKYHMDGPYIDSVVFRIFPDEGGLLANVNSLTAVKDYDAQNSAHALNDRFRVLEYSLPQYVAAFLNTQSPILSVPKVRFGFLLATDKEAILKELGGGNEIVDTPILEAKEGLDIEYNELRAKGAFFDTEWKLGKKDPVPAGEEKLHVEIRAHADTSVSLIVDGKKIGEVLLSAGDKKQFDFQKEFMFESVGDAGGITFFVNDVEGKKLGLDGEVIKDFVITRAAINEVLTQALPVPPENSTTVPASPDSSPDVTAPASDVRSDYVPPEDAAEVFVLNPDPDEIRRDAQGNFLRLRLITSSSPKEYVTTARLLQEQWLKAGVDLIVEVYEPDVLQEKIKLHNYDVLLFGQTLGYNLDAFPFWHSSQVESGLNLSQYKSFETDALLTEIRSLFDDGKKATKLDSLKKRLIEDTPAVFLYRPVYQYAVDRNVQGVSLSKLGIDSDRFGGIHQWFVRQKKVLREGVRLADFMEWIYNNLSFTRN